MSITNQALAILAKYKWHIELPASLSGKNHCGETVMEHLRRTAMVVKHMCLEFGISKEDEDMLVACAYLHDIGNVLITVPGKIDDPEWKYYEATNVSRNRQGWWHHGVLSALVIDEHEIDRKEEIKRIVSTHMSAWFPTDPQPENLYEYILCMADYTASFGDKLFLPPEEQK